MPVHMPIERELLERVCHTDNHTRKLARRELRTLLTTRPEYNQSCECPLTIRALDDGCRYCQPQGYIDRLHDQIEEDRRTEEHADGQ